MSGTNKKQANKPTLNLTTALDLNYQPDFIRFPHLAVIYFMKMTLYKNLSQVFSKIDPNWLRFAFRFQESTMMINHSGEMITSNVYPIEALLICPKYGAVDVLEKIRETIEIEIISLVRIAAKENGYFLVYNPEYLLSLIVGNTIITQDNKLRGIVTKIISEKSVELRFLYDNETKTDTEIISIKELIAGLKKPTTEAGFLRLTYMPGPQNIFPKHYLDLYQEANNLLLDVINTLPV